MSDVRSNEYFVKMDSLMPLFREQLSRGQSIRFSPRGVSMLPMLRQGIDSVVLSPLPERLKKYDIPLYQRDNGQYILHRIVKVGDTYTCLGDNQFAEEKGVRPDQMIAVVTAFYRKDRMYKTDDVSYQCYCWLWHYSRGMRRIWRGLKRRLHRLIAAARKF